jgi:hypothetical protein
MKNFAASIDDFTAFMQKLTAIIVKFMAFINHKYKKIYEK